MTPIAPALLEVLRCPRCKGPLTHEPAPPSLDCAACRLRYPIRDEIPILLVDEAAPLP